MCLTVSQKKMRLWVLLVALLLQQYSVSGLSPVFSCWFPTYTLNNTMIPNIIFGYTNNDTVDTTIPVTMSADTGIGSNVIIPLIYNSGQPSVFGTTSVIYAVTVVDDTNYLAASSDNYILWSINGTFSVPVTASLLTSINTCVNVPATTSSCLVATTNFCDDGLYCNGLEICVPDFSGSATGSCHFTTEVVQCNSSMVCSETYKQCVDTEMPTHAPTSAPTESPTEAPTEAMTGAPTETLSTDTPTVSIIDVVVCVSDVDCVNTSTFCGGPTMCNTTTHVCSQANVSYDPCVLYREALRDFYIATNATTFPIDIACVDIIDVCVEAFTCGSDADCSDNIVCNGVEQCIDGRCYFQVDQSIAFICNTSLPMTCIEPSGCTPLAMVDTTPPTNAPTNATAAPATNNDSLVVGIIVAVLVVVGMILLVVILYFEFGQNDSYIASMNVGGSIGLSGRVNSRINTKYGRYHRD